MIIINNNEANSILEPLRVKINELNKFDFLEKKTNLAYRRFLNKLTGAVDIEYFSQYIIGWLSNNEYTSWKLLKIDDCSGFGCRDEKIILGSHLISEDIDNGLFLQKLREKIDTTKIWMDAYFFKFNDDNFKNYYHNIKLSQIISYLIAHEQHGHLLSFNDDHYKMVSIQDGEITIITTESDSNTLDDFMSGLQSNDFLEYRQWVWSEDE